jgi:hypothetical protein
MQGPHHVGDGFHTTRAVATFLLGTCCGTGNCA